LLVVNNPNDLYEYLLKSGRSNEEAYFTPGVRGKKTTYPRQSYSALQKTLW